MIDAAASAEPTGPAPIMTHSVMTSAQGLFLILNAASLRRLPMPFAARAYDYSPVVDFQFYDRAQVCTWAAGLDVAEVVEEPTMDGVYNQTRFETVWLDVPIRCVSSVPREPR